MDINSQLSDCIRASKTYNQILITAALKSHLKKRMASEEVATSNEVAADEILDPEG